MLSLESLVDISDTLLGVKERSDTIKKGWDNWPSFLQREISIIFQSHNIRIWQTKGGEIGSDWQGHTLIDTGKLFDSLNSEQIEISGNGTKLVYTSNVDYSKYVDEKYGIYGFSSTLEIQLDTVIRKFIITGEV